MSNADDDLPFGLYERLVTAGLKARLLRFDSDGARIVKKELDPAEAHATLARHIANLVARTLNALPQEDRAATQSALTNQIVSLLVGNPATGATQDDLIEIPPEELRAIQPIGQTPSANRDVVAPLVALSASDLLVNARGEPGLAHALAHEIPSADSIDLLCAFVRWHGLRLLEDQLEAHCRVGRRLRVITTVFTGSTERKALDWLVAHGAQVKVSYDTQSTRLHAKAWLFSRASGYSTAYIGSSNLSKSALVDGVEWNVRLSQVGSPDIIEKFDATFDTYWESPEYESYEPARDAARFDRAVAPQQSEFLEAPLLFLDVEPWPHQREMLEKLAVERERHHRFKNLVVAATGTGKTIVAALDYKRLRDQHGDLRVLFVAHRQEILKQSLGAFRQVLRSGDFGELYVDGHRPDEWRHVFASIQSLAQVDLEHLDPTAFDVVIVDEFHHAAAPTYRRLLEHLFKGDEVQSLRQPPRILLGLTATPERTDAEDILHYFDNHTAVEMRLWDALERGLLCPFQYFALHDNTDLSSVRWSRKGYDLSELERLYTGDDARVRLVLEQVRQKHREAGAMRALGFCVSIAHAQFMARRFTEAGLPSVAVSADTDSDARKDALASLRAGRVRVLFAVDLFNEGVDLPEVDTLLFLRPTESALVFLQQLGRGLRRHERKDCVTVLDFIGQSHRQFRFDLRYRAITGTTRTEVEKQVQLGFPFLPAGCSMQLDRVATQIVLDNLKSAIPSRRPAMVKELRALAEARSASGRRITLVEFLQEAGLELEDVYRSGSWSSLQRESRLSVPASGPSEALIGDRLASILHVDDPLRLGAYERLAATASVSVMSDADRRLVTGFHFAVFPSKIAPKTLAESVALLHAHPAIVEELRELLWKAAGRGHKMATRAANIGRWRPMDERFRDLLAANKGRSQPGIAWPRARWQRAFPGVSMFHTLPDLLDRTTVRSVCTTAVMSEDAARDAFLAAMAWGYGEVGYGPWRVKKAFQDPDAGKKLLAVAETLKEGGPVAAYTVMSGASRLHRIGPAFGSKFLYFADPRTHLRRALILDRLVAKWLRENTAFRPNPVPWAPETYAAYLDCMHEWATALGEPPEALELAMFVSMTPPTSQWNVDVQKLR